MNDMNMNDPKMASILRRIRALKAQAEGKGTTEAEAATFAAKVSEMLSQYNLEEAQLDLKQQEEIGHEDYEGNWNASPARRALAIAVCRLYYVKPLIRRKAKWSLIGRKHNIVEAIDMTGYLIKTTLRLGNEWHRSHHGESVTDFKRGCFARLVERLNDLYREQAQKEKPVYSAKGNPSNLPALYKNEDQLMNEYMRRTWSHIGTYSGRIRETTSASAAGRAAGDKISLSRQVGGNSGHLLPKK